jgi:DNA mismatch repair protein MLH3
MTATGDKILPLPEEVTKQIRSSTTITSLAVVVLGLLQNSLDAGSRKIDIIVDLGHGGCSIEDNGIGIIPDEFEIDGGLGRLHCESRENRTVAPDVLVEHMLTFDFGRHL